MDENSAGSPRREYKQIRRDPMSDKIRDSTDCLFTYLFGVIFSTWLGLLIYVFITEHGFRFPNNTIDDHDREVDLRSMNYTVIDLPPSIEKQPIHGLHYQEPNALIIVTGLSLAITFVLSFLIILRYYPRLIAYIGIICIKVLIVKSITEIFFGDLLTKQLNMLPAPVYQVLNSTGATIIVCITKIIFCIFALICLIEVEVSAIADILRRAINALFLFSHLILFGLVIVILELVVVFLSILAYHSPNSSSIILYLILFGGLYLFTFIFYYAKMIITPTISSTFWAQDKDASKSSLFKNIALITRYHFGTASLAAMPILPLCIGLYATYKLKIDSAKSLLNRIIDIFLIIYLIFNAVDYSLIISTMYGENLLQSTKRTFRLMTKNSSLTLAFIYIFYALLLVVALSMAFLAAVPALIWSQKTYAPSIYAVVLIMPLFFLFDLTGQICLLYSFEDDEDDDKSQENTCQTSSTITLSEISILQN